MKKASFKQDLSYFIHRERIIRYYRYKNEAEDFITFLDEGLRAKEESDYASRIITLPDLYSKEKFTEKPDKFGTLTFT